MTLRYRRIVFPILLASMILVLASTLSEVVSPVLFAMLLAVILNPLVDAAARFKLPRVATVAMLYMALVLVVILSTAGVSGQFRALGRALQGEEFHGDLDGNGLVTLSLGPGQRPEFTDLNANSLWDGGALISLKALVNSERTRLPEGVWGDALDELGRGVLDMLDKLGGPSTGVLASGIESAAVQAGGLLQLLTLLVLIPFYLFFFLVEYPAIRQRMGDLVPPRHRDMTERIARDVGQELVSFLRGRLSCGLVKAVMLWVGMMMMSIPFALPIALVSGLLSLVPFLGFLAGVLPAALLALTMAGGGTDALLYVIALFATAEAFEGAVLYPFLLGKETGLHPIALVVVLLAGGSLMGTLGVLAAVPLALICKVLWRELGQRFYREWAASDIRESDEPSADPVTAP
ncbi:MAG: putative PurR-regulated permease PerM [Pseudohongiellaceae bacterium]|jgi:predicted PurR-regulated permease PerM